MIPAPEITALISLGFVVLVPEYRLCPQVSISDGPVADAKDCLAWARTSLPRLLEAETGVLVDANRVVAMGQSSGANLALHLVRNCLFRFSASGEIYTTDGLSMRGDIFLTVLSQGALPSPPLAILDFYGAKYLGDPFWTKPFAPFAAIPPIDSTFLQQIYSGPQALTSGPLFVSGKPDLTSPRNAWLISALRDGTWLGDCVKDGDVERVDPVRAFGKAFPPTCFVHGTADISAPWEISDRASRTLRDMGAESEFIKVEGAPHVFDLTVKEGDAWWEAVMTGLRFLKDHV